MNMCAFNCNDALVYTVPPGKKHQHFLFREPVTSLPRELCYGRASSYCSSSLVDLDGVCTPRDPLYFTLSIQLTKELLRMAQSSSSKDRVLPGLSCAPLTVLLVLDIHALTHSLDPPLCCAGWGSPLSTGSLRCARGGEARLGSSIRRGSCHDSVRRPPTEPAAAACSPGMGWRGGSREAEHDAHGHCLDQASEGLLLSLRLSSRPLPRPASPPPQRLPGSDLCGTLLLS